MAEKRKLVLPAALVIAIVGGVTTQVSCGDSNACKGTCADAHPSADGGPTIDAAHPIDSGPLPDTPVV
jgi:hypothetical protein